MTSIGELSGGARCTTATVQGAPAATNSPAAIGASTHGGRLGEGAAGRVSPRQCLGVAVVGLIPEEVRGHILPT